MNTLQRSLQHEIDLMEAIIRELSIASSGAIKLNASVGRLKQLIAHSASAALEPRFPRTVHLGGHMPDFDHAKERMRAVLGMMPLEALELDAQVIRTLNAHGIYRISDLTMRTEANLEAMDSAMWRFHAQHIKSELSFMGLNLANSSFSPYAVQSDRVPYGYRFHESALALVERQPRYVVGDCATGATPGNGSVVGLQEEAKVADVPALEVKPDLSVETQAAVQLEEIKHSRAVNKIHGQRFGKLVVVGETGRSYKGDKVNWLAKCHCDCGNTCAYQPSFLVKGMYVDCRECTNVVTHSDVKKKERKQRYSTGTAESKTPEYQGWRNALHPGTAHKLKERGVKRPTYGRWLKSYEHFLEDVGYQPVDGARIQRLDKDLGWVPNNVAWVDKKGVIRKGLASRRSAPVEAMSSKPATKAEAQPRLQNGLR